MCMCYKFELYINNFFLGVWWWNPTLKSNLYDINIIPFKIYLQFYVSRINFVNFPRLSFSIKRKTSSNVPNYVWWFCCWPIKLQKLKFQTSFFEVFFFSFFLVCSRLQLYTYIGLRFKKPICNYYYYYYYYFLSSQEPPSRTQPCKGRGYSLLERKLFV